MEDKEIWVANIAMSTTADGPGLRNALYVSGCDLHCPYCHNKDWWPKESGKKMQISEVYAQLNEDDFNISILGGEPLMQYDSILTLCKEIKARTHKTIWLWSGHTIEDIKQRFPEILEYIDVLVDGPFIQAEADRDLKWRGSANQRIIVIADDE